MLCAKLGYRLPGKNTIPEQIANNKKPYYDALEIADASFSNGKTDVSKLEQMLDALLAKQLVTVHDQATQNNVADKKELVANEGSSKKPEKFTRKSEEGVLGWIEQHPVLLSLIGVIAAAVLAAVLTAIFAG